MRIFTFVTLVMGLFIFSSTTTNAGNLAAGDIITFNPGDPLSSDDMNTNFSNVRTAINDNDSRIAGLPGVTTYDFSSYISASNIIQKTFNTTFNTTSACRTATGTITWDYARVADGADTIITRTDISKNNIGVVCKYAESGIRITPTEIQLTSRKLYDTTGVTLQSSRIFATPLTRLTSSMIIGQSWGDATTTAPDPGNIVAKISLLGIEDVTVPYGTLNSCLKVHILQHDQYGGKSTMAWVCPGIGKVKHIDFNATNLKSTIFELTAITIN